MEANYSSETAPRWHTVTESEVFEMLDVDLTAGLLDDEVRTRQIQFGPNRLSARRDTPAWKRFLQQFNQPLIYILLIAGVVTSVLSEYVDSIVIFMVVLINAVVGYLQESKAEQAIEALSKMVTTKATVRRNGKTTQVPAEQLVPGDVVLLQSGDKVPADLRLFRNKSLQVDESTLTGESIPVQKQTDPLAPDTLLADRKNLAFAGTLVTYGQAEGIVWAIGNQTETGRIARLLTGTIVLSTPLTRKIHHFSKILLWAILGLAVLTFTVGLIRGESAVAMFMAAVALAVGAIPEGLPAAVTITLAIGVHRMAQRRAIIRKLPAVETLGSTTVICSDKTGTLTENQMTVQEIYAGGSAFRVTGTGYDPSGEIMAGENRTALAQNEALRQCLLAGLLCNDSQLIQEEGTWKVQGDPTEAALIVAAGKAGLIGAEQLAGHARIDSIPFESQHQYMATLHGHPRAGQRIIFKKGSLEKILERAADRLLASGETGTLNPDEIRATAEEMAAKGLRVLAFARRVGSEEQDRLDHSHVAEGLTFLGLQGMIDPPREEAIESVRKCRAAGIQVKMITGDHIGTARAIALQLGLRESENADLIAVTGQDLEKTPDTQLPGLATRASVFARVAPEQKLKLVRALQSSGHIVAMTGDGVNDAPALKQADIGVAMGISGTEVAKGAADMLLLDDNFASIEAAVEEGRSVFDNLSKFIVWTLPTNGGEALVILAAIFLGTALPVQPVHILWINMATAIMLGLMLVFEPKEANLMQRPPREPGQPILTFPLLMRTGLVTSMIVMGAFGLFLYERRVLGSEVTVAQTVVLNVIVMIETVYLMNCRSLLHSMFHLGMFSNPWIFVGIPCMIGSQFLITYAPFMNRLFHTAPIDGNAWLRILIVALITFVVVEIEKSLRVRQPLAIPT